MVSAVSSFNRRGSQQQDDGERITRVENRTNVLLLIVIFLDVEKRN